MSTTGWRMDGFIRRAKIFPFAQMVDAYKYLESNAQVGKVVITVP
jgi:hypothetical protein